MGDRAPIEDPIDRAVVEFVRQFRRDHGHGPTDAEGAGHFDWESPWAFGYRAQKLVRAGHLERPPGHRSLRVADERPGTSYPLVGVVAAGGPLPPLGEEGERLYLHELFPHSADLVALRVKGDSMRDAHIVDGDYVLVRRDPDPPNRAKVVVSIGGELTLKVLRRSRERKSGRAAVVLEPCNAEMEPIELVEDEGTFIVGTLAGVIRPPK
jgi:repressor LexA